MILRYSGMIVTFKSLERDASGTIRELHAECHPQPEGQKLPKVFVTSRLSATVVICQHPGSSTAHSGLTVMNSSGRMPPKGSMHLWVILQELAGVLALPLPCKKGFELRMHAHRGRGHPRVT